MEDSTAPAPHGASLDLATQSIENEKFWRRAGHDMRGPLVAISNLTQLILLRNNGQLDPDLVQMFELIQGQARELDLAIISVVKYAAQPTAPLQPQTLCSLQEVVQFAIAENCNSLEETAGEIHVGDIPLLCMEESDLLTIVAQLIANALQFRSSLKPQISFSGPVSAPGMFTVCVSDNGIGVDPQKLESIFEPFSQIGAVSVSGNGLGLALCRKILLRYGGTIWAQPSAAGGLSVCFSIPDAPQSRHKAA